MDPVKPSTSAADAADAAPETATVSRLNLSLNISSNATKDINHELLDLLEIFATNRATLSHLNVDPSLADRLWAVADGVEDAADEKAVVKMQFCNDANNRNDDDDGFQRKGYDVPYCSHRHHQRLARHLVQSPSFSRRLVEISIRGDSGGGGDDKHEHEQHEHEADKPESAARQRRRFHTCYRHLFPLEPYQSAGSMGWRRRQYLLQAIELPLAVSQPAPRYGAALLSKGHLVYIIGGRVKHAELFYRPSPSAGDGTSKTGPEPEASDSKSSSKSSKGSRSKSRLQYCNILQYDTVSRTFSPVAEANSLSSLFSFTAEQQMSGFLRKHRFCLVHASAAWAFSAAPTNADNADNAGNDDKTEIHVFGGMVTTLTGTASQCNSRAFSFNLLTGRWSRLEERPPPLQPQHLQEHQRQLWGEPLMPRRFFDELVTVAEDFKNDENDDEEQEEDDVQIVGTRAPIHVRAPKLVGQAGALAPNGDLFLVGHRTGAEEEGDGVYFRFRAELIHRKLMTVYRGSRQRQEKPAAVAAATAATSATSAAAPAAATRARAQAAKASAENRHSNIAPLAVTAADQAAAVAAAAADCCTVVSWNMLPGRFARPVLHHTTTSNSSIRGARRQQQQRDARLRRWSISMETWYAAVESVAPIHAALAYQQDYLGRFEADQLEPPYLLMVGGLVQEAVGVEIQAGSVYHLRRALQITLDGPEAGLRQWVVLHGDNGPEEEEEEAEEAERGGLVFYYSDDSEDYDVKCDEEDEEEEEEEDNEEDSVFSEEHKETTEKKLADKEKKEEEEEEEEEDDEEDAPKPTPARHPRFPVARYGMAYATFRGGLFIAGGADRRGHYLNDIWRLDLTSKRWRLFGRLPAGLLHASMTVTDQGLMVIFGGLLTQCGIATNLVVQCQLTAAMPTELQGALEIVSREREPEEGASARRRWEHFYRRFGAANSTYGVATDGFLTFLADRSQWNQEKVEEFLRLSKMNSAEYVAYLDRNHL